MFNTVHKKITAAFIFVTTISMLSMLIIVGYGSAKLLIDRITLDGELYAKQMTRSIAHIGVDNPDKIKAFVKQSIDEEPSIINIQIVDADGKILIDNDSSKYDTTADSKVTQVIADGKAAQFPSDDGLAMVVPITVDGNVQGAISVTSKMDSTWKTLIDTVSSVGIFAILLLLLVLAVSYIVSKKITKPIKNAVSALQVISTGDLTTNVKVESKDEFGTLASTMNTTMENLREMIGGIQNATTDLDSASQVLSYSSEEVASTSMEVAKSASHVADGASTQSMMLSESVDLLEEFGRSIDTIDVNVGNVSTSSHKIKQSADLGSEKIEELVKSVKDIQQAFKYVIDKLNTLNSSVGKITEITEVINTVAGQTNLLALNAAIEAARAGESGRGFAVVADEIRVLAEQVSTSSKNIMDLVSNVTSETMEVTQTADSVSGKMNTQASTVENTIEAFKDILEQVSLIVPQIDNVNTSLKQALKAKEEIVHNVESVSSVSAEVTSSSQQIAASTEEQTASAEELTSTAQSLAGMSSMLHKSVEKFKL